VACPFCGGSLGPGQTDSPPPLFEPKWVHWRKFFLVLLTPAALCFLTMMINLAPIAILTGLIGSIAAGLICAGIGMESSNLTGFKRGIAHFCVAIALCALAWGLCFVGCVG